MTAALITGGAGFIGSNLARRLLDDGHRVTVFDNLSRPGGEANLAWLRERGGDRLRIVRADVTDFASLLRATEGVARVYHLAGQVAVTTSVRDPRRDFEDNALGTFNALEAARLAGDDPVFVYASTNKVYGAMEWARVLDDGTRYRYADHPRGIPESAPLDFHSPYGCSKGAGDQYARDYHRIYGLRTVVLRQSCIYGPRQFGIEDQGWVAWFLIAAITGRPITICGDGRQVRDVLHVDDLLDAYELAVDRIGHCAGRVYNVGGGPDNTLAVWSEFGPLIEALTGRRIPVRYEAWRPGDQRVYVSSIDRMRDDLGWWPRIPARRGIERLHAWLCDHRALYAGLQPSAAAAGHGAAASGRRAASGGAPA